MSAVLLIPDLPVEGWPSMDRYASRLAEHLPREAPDLEYRLAGEVAPLPTGAGARSSLIRDVPPARVSEAGRYLRRYVSYPRRVRRQPGHVAHILDHSYAHLVPAAARRPTVVTVHDLMPVRAVRRPPAGLRDRVRNGFLRRVLAGLRAADCWIVATDWMRGELAEWLGADNGIAVIPFGVDDAFFEPAHDPVARLRRHLGVPEEGFLVLHVGSVVERKNIPGVLAAVDGLRERGLDPVLLQVGGTFTDAQCGEIAARGLGGIVHQIPDASEEDLRRAYRAADALLFPSHYEGFGFPVLEAMAAELPVVTSAAASLAGVAGDAALVVEDRDPEAYVDALARIAHDGALVSTLREQGRQRAWSYTWGATARGTAEVYRGLV